MRTRSSLPAGVLIAGLILTALTTYGFQRLARDRDRVRFNAAVEVMRDRIRVRLDDYVAMLLGTRALFAASMHVTPSEFREYIEKLELPYRYPGVQAVGFAEKITREDVPAAEKRLQEALMSEFRVWPLHDQVLLYPITYIEPLDRRNRGVLGFDMYNEPERRHAMEDARDSGQPHMTGILTLKQEIEPEKQDGFLIYVPVYRGTEKPVDLEHRRASITGFVYSPFRVDDFFSGIFVQEAHPNIEFSVFDEDDRSASGLFFSSNFGSAEEYRPSFTSSSTLTLAGHVWGMEFRTRQQFEDTSAVVFAPWLALAGLAITLVLFGVTGAEVRARAKAEASDRAHFAARREAENERNNLHALFMQAPAAIAILRGPDHRYELSNPMNRDLVGGKDLVGRTVAEGFPELVAQGMVTQLDTVYKTGQPVSGREVPLTINHADGEQREVYVNGMYHPLRGPNGELTGVMAFAYEVTDQVLARKRVEAAEVSLRQAVQARDEFLSIAGHELKTPLAALQLQLQGLERQAKRGSEEAQGEKLLLRLGKMISHLERLTSLVNELLDVSRITAGRLIIRREELNLAELVGEVIDRFSDAASRAHCELQVELQNEVLGRWDRSRIDQVITNLITNAIKYGPGKPVEIAVKHAGDRAMICVRDHGIGISDKDRERIFGRFERAVSERNYGGFGLGLWISRQIVDAHGGTIRCDSVEGKGSTFIVELPYVVDVLLASHM